MAAALTVPWSRVLAQAAEATPSIPIPPPITSAERVSRLRHAQELMRAKGIGSVASCVGPGILTVTQTKVFNNSGSLTFSSN